MRILNFCLGPGCLVSVMSPLLHGHWAMCKKRGDGVMSVKGRATRTRRIIGGTFLGGCLPEGHRALLVPLEQQIPVALGAGRGHKLAALRNAVVRV